MTEIEKEMPKEKFSIQNRRLLVVWIYTMKQLNHLKRFGDIAYISKKMKYVVIYMNEEKIEAAEEKISRLHFVRKVERSYRPDVEMNFSDRIGTKEALIFKDEGFEVEEKNTTIKLAQELA